MEGPGACVTRGMDDRCRRNARLCEPQAAIPSHCTDSNEEITNDQGVVLPNMVNHSDIDDPVGKALGRLLAE